MAAPVNFWPFTNSHSPGMVVELRRYPCHSRCWLGGTMVILELCCTQWNCGRGSSSGSGVGAIDTKDVIASMMVESSS